LEDHVLRFKNVLGAVKLQFKGSSVVKSVALKGNNNEVIAGAATVIAHDGFETPSVVMAKDGATEVVLDCGEGVQVSKEGTNFVFALPPVKFEKGFTVTVTYADESTYTVEATTANEVLRSGVLVMPEVTLPSLTFSSVSSMTDAELNVALEGYTGFYGMFLMPGMWENVKMYIEYGYFGFSDVLAGAMGQELPCYLYEGQTYAGKLTEFGIAPEYFEYDMYNWIQPNTTYTLGIVPVVEGKVEYTVEDVKLFEVSTNSFSYGANLALPEVTVEEGYNETVLTFAGSEEVTYVKYEIFKVENGEVLPNTDWTTGEPIEFPTEDNYIDAVTYEAEYDAETGFQIYVSNDYGVEPGAEYKLCVMLVNAEGKTSLHKMDVKTLPIPYNNDLQVSFAGALEYDDLTNSVDAVVNVPAEAVKLYYTFMNTRYWDAKQISSAVVSIVEGSTGWEFVDLTDATQVVDGQVSFNFEVGTMNKYGAAKVGVHVVAVDANGKVSQYVTSELSVDKYVPAE
jgi:hypothetical protein